MESNELQGTNEWFEDRSGRITASKYKDIKTNGKQAYGLGAGAITYGYQLIAERVSIDREQSFSGDEMDYGSENEPVAIELYEMKMFVNVERVGFREIKRIKDSFI